MKQLGQNICSNIKATRHGFDPLRQRSNIHIFTPFVALFQMHRALYLPKSHSEKKLETSLKCKYISDVFLNKLSEIENDPGSKLIIYGRIKQNLNIKSILIMTSLKP